MSQLKFILSILTIHLSLITANEARAQIKPAMTINSGQIWTDDNGVHINAHGGGIIYFNDRYYWFGEHKTAGKGGNSALVGIGCYSSSDLYNWKNEGIVLKVEENSSSEITKGCVMERPKVIFNEKTGQFVMWFHLEYKGSGYKSARTGVATSNNITGPYKYLQSYRPNAGIWPIGYEGEKVCKDDVATIEWWTPAFYNSVNDGVFVRRDFNEGQMSRDMTIFLDDDGTAYHIRSSEENLTLHIAKLSSDYLSFTNQWIRVFPGGHNEAPAVFKYNQKYYMITSGCTGWEPNEARLSVADSMMGKWTYLGNPCIGKNSDKTFFSQSTYVLQINNCDNSFIFMGDRWTPENPVDGRYVWLPVVLRNDIPYIKWMKQWNLNEFLSACKNEYNGYNTANESHHNINK